MVTQEASFSMGGIFGSYSSFAEVCIEGIHVYSFYVMMIYMLNMIMNYSYKVCFVWIVS